MWYDTVGAEVVATVHNGKPTFKLAVAMYRKAFKNVVKVFGNIEYSGSTCKALVDVFGKLM